MTVSIVIFNTNGNYFREKSGKKSASSRNSTTLFRNIVTFFMSIIDTNVHYISRQSGVKWASSAKHLSRPILNENGLYIALDGMHSSAVLSLFRLFFFVKSQLELVGVTRETSRH